MPTLLAAALSLATGLLLRLIGLLDTTNLCLLLMLLPVTTGLGSWGTTTAGSDEGAPDPAAAARDPQYWERRPLPLPLLPLPLFLRGPNGLFMEGLGHGYVAPCSVLRHRLH